MAEKRECSGREDALSGMSGRIRTAVSFSSSSSGRIQTMVRREIVGKGVSGSLKGISESTERAFKDTEEGEENTDTGVRGLRTGVSCALKTGEGIYALKKGGKLAEKSFVSLKSFPEALKRRSLSIGKKIEKAFKGIRKSGSLFRKALSLKTNGKILLCVLCFMLLLITFDGVTILTTSLFSSLTSWMFPDGEGSYEEAQRTISSYLREISALKEEKESEVQEISESLSDEYRYDGTRIDGLNRFGNTEITPFDDRAVIAFVAARRFGSSSVSIPSDLRFTDSELEEALECFYDLDYHYEYDHCPECDCNIYEETLSLSDGDFEIEDISYERRDRCWYVTFRGDIFSQTSRVYTELEMYVTSGGAITGEGAAYLSGDSWYMAYGIDDSVYDSIDWDKVYLDVSVVYCDNESHRYLYGEVNILSEEEMILKGGLTDTEEMLYHMYLEQIEALEER